MAEGPGWLVLSLKESWGPPLGYVTPTDDVGADPCVRPSPEPPDNEPAYVPPEYHPSLLQPFPGTHHTPLTIWQATIANIGADLRPGASSGLFEQLQKVQPASFIAGELILTVPDDLTRRTLSERTTSLLERHLAGGSLGAVVSVRFIVEDEPENPLPEVN